MSHNLKIKNKASFDWLSNLMDKTYNKIKENPSALSEIAEYVMDLQEACDNVVVKRDDDPDEKKKKPVIKDDYIPNLCKEHPKNEIKRPPRTNCKGCWAAYKRLHPNAYEQARRKFIRKNKEND